jgi:hypothetical protein
VPDANVGIREELPIQQLSFGPNGHYPGVGIFARLLDDYETFKPFSNLNLLVSKNDIRGGASSPENSMDLDDLQSKLL